MRARERPTGSSSIAWRKTGLPLHVVYNLHTRWLIKAVELARVSGISRKTVCNWCENNRGFGIRLGRVWYVDLEAAGWSWERARDLFRKLRTEYSGPSDDGEEE